MNQSKILKIIQIVLFAATVLTALVLMIFFPPMHGIGYQAFLGLMKEPWLDVHKWIGAAFAVAAIAYLIFSKKKA
jgi:hypothetical protein